MERGVRVRRQTIGYGEPGHAVFLWCAKCKCWTATRAGEQMAA